MGRTARVGRWGSLLLLLAGALVAASAAAQVRDNPVRFGNRQVHIGDTMGKVRDCAGAPDSIVHRDGSTVWVYERSPHTPRTSMIVITDGVVSGTRVY